MAHDQAPDPKRRQLVFGAAAGVAAMAAGRAAAQCSLPTPAQTEGPFYPVADREDEDTDLLQVAGRSGRAQGEAVELTGRVVDEACAPVAGALVEIWQADHNGRYNHPSDPNNRTPLDEDFQYWGKTVSDGAGRFSFRTIIPGAYPATASWWRPPHIHFKVAKRGFRELTTQMYFAGQELNEGDFILQELSAAQRAKVIVNFSRNSDAPGNLPRGHFEITITRPRRT